MISSVGRRLRVAFDRHPPPTEVPTPADPLPPAIELIAYGEECLLSGRVRLAAERLTDMLDAHDEFLLLDVLVERLDDGTAVEAAEILVRRDELLLVQATGPRGSVARRRRTRAHALAARVGPYHVRGYVHALPGVDPLLAVRRRRVMVPFTEATIELVVGGVPQIRRAGTVVVNRDWFDWVALATVDDAATAIPELPIAIDTGPLVKDFTGDIRGVSMVSMSEPPEVVVAGR